jgi:hypothetical protein
MYYFKTRTATNLTTYFYQAAPACNSTGLLKEKKTSAKELSVSYPRLRRKVLDDYYSPMSDAPETTFSCGRRTILWSRAEFKPENVKFSN